MSSDDAVRGERAFARNAPRRPAVVRLQSAVAGTIVLLVAAGLLAWYYQRAGDDRRTRAVAATTGVRSAIASEMKLPALGAADVAASPADSQMGAAARTEDVADASAAQGRAALRALRRESDPVSARVRTETATPRATAPVLSRPSESRAAPPMEPVLAALGQPATASEAMPTARQGAGSLDDALQVPLARPTEAGIVASRRWLLPKGSFLDCTLETAIDSTFPGLATCVVATDTFGADGRVVLLERGTKLVGETRSDVRAGQARVAIVWTEARTPTGVVVNLGSPGTDALGRAGVAGAVDRHTGERFGAAVLLSVLDTVSSGLAASRAGGGAIVYNAQSAHDVATEVLRNTIAIPPTIRIAQGARVLVSVVRDVDFRLVYQLIAHEER